MSIERLTESVRQQVANRAMRAGPNLDWAQRIVEQHAAGTFCGGVHAVKEAQKVLEDRAALVRSGSSNAP
ncbi:MAG: hypothetical protein Q7K57_44745 [Burkholderiaceae bacterium]|nr:hypothetical protein [Burkholderiaceae bacterium]